MCGRSVGGVGGGGGVLFKTRRIGRWLDRVLR